MVCFREYSRVSIDQTGILDHRLMSTSIAWQEIAAIWPVETDRTSVVDIELPPAKRKEALQLRSGCVATEREDVCRQRSDFIARKLDLRHY